MKRIFYTFSIALLFVGIAYCQSVDKLASKRRCVAPNQGLYPKVLAQSNGDIVHTPCPTGSSIFEGVANFTGTVNFTGTPNLNNAVFTGNTDFSNSTILAPFRLLDKNYANAQLLTTYFSIGNLSANPITLPVNGLIPAIIDLELRGDPSVAGLFSRITATTLAGTTLAYSPLTGVYGSVQNTGDLNTNRVLTGVRGTAYQRSAAFGSVAAYGGYFEAFTGGNLGITNTTPMYGVYAKASGGHNGTSPLVVGVFSNVSNVGGGGVGNITEGIAVQAQFDGGLPITNYITAKGLALQGWGAANGGTYTNSYGIYADTSIDRGTVNRFFIYSLSTSPSLLSGVLYVAQDVYITDTTKGMVLKSPDGTCYRFTVANGGALSAGAAIACP